MRKFRSLRLVLLSSVLVFACGKDLPELKGVDMKVWKNDPDGCKGDRSGMIDAVKAEREKLLALDEIQITKVLGRPDRNELFKRNQKFYYYFLQPSPDCKADSAAKALKLVVRFNAMGLANEVTVE